MFEYSLLNIRVCMCVCVCDKHEYYVFCFGTKCKNVRILINIYVLLWKHIRECQIFSVRYDYMWMLTLYFTLSTNTQ